MRPNSHRSNAHRNFVMSQVALGVSLFALFSCLICMSAPAGLTGKVRALSAMQTSSPGRASEAIENVWLLVTNECKSCQTAVKDAARFSSPRLSNKLRILAPSMLPNQSEDVVTVSQQMYDDMYPGYVPALVAVMSNGERRATPFSRDYLKALAETS
jgi:hypothetical protein